MSYWSTTGLCPGHYYFPIMTLPNKLRIKIATFCRRCFDLLFWQIYSRNRIKSAMCFELTYAMVLRKWAPYYIISAHKSAVMLIWKQSQVKHSNLAVSMNGDLLEHVCSTKYLGVTVDSTLSWASQCDNLCFKLAGKIAVLHRIRSFVKTETLKLLYENTIQPVMDYACSLWRHTKNLISVNFSMYNIIVLLVL